jgi:hypothetical protein
VPKSEEKETSTTSDKLIEQMDTCRKMIKAQELKNEEVLDLLGEIEVKKGEVV